MGIKGLSMDEINSFSLLEKFQYNNLDYILWFDDEEVRIGFSQIPLISNLLINKKIMSKEEIKEIKKKPFILNNDIKVFLEDKIQDEIYIFEINKGYRYDGASIPKFAWFLVGSKEDVRFKVASLLHDVLCENHGFVENDRYFSTKIFDKCAKVGGCCAFVRFLIFHSVDNFQKFQKWKK